MLTLLLKKHTYQNTWYLFQVTDADGYPQVSPASPALLAPWGVRVVPVQHSIWPIRDSRGFPSFSTPTRVLPLLLGCTTPFPLLTIELECP